MATIGTTFPNLIDAYKNSAEGTVVEILNQQNAILDDAIATECNMGTLHRHMIRTGLPSVSWGRLYKGTPQSKATVQQVDDATGFLEAASGIDVRLLKLAKDKAKARLTDSAPFLEAMSQEMAAGMFYHDTATAPEKFKGLSTRFNSVAKVGSGTQVIDGGGTGSDNTSIWFVTWGDHAATLLYPEGTKAGVDIQDKGEQRILDGNGDGYYIKETRFEWHIGLAIKDWRYIARIANIDVSDMLAGTVDVWALLRKAYYKLQSRRRDGIQSRIAIYMNRDVLEVLDAQSTNQALITGRPNYNTLTHATVEGKEVMTYRNIPIREIDALLNTEARVV